MKWLPSYGWDAKFEFEEARSLAGGLTLSEVEPRQDGRRTYKVELPPALRGVDVAPMRADWKCVVATRPWSGAQQPTKMWVRDWARLTITIDPEPAAEVYYDGKLSPWPPGRPITSHGQNIQEAGKHHLRVVWPDGRSAEADFEVALGGDVDLLMTADKRIVERRTIAQTGSHPYLFRDRRGCNWLLWDEAVTQHGGTFLVQRAPESDLYFATSPDGSSWSAPRRLPVSSPDLDMQPILQQDSRGTYWLAWLSDRDPEHPKSLWLSSSADGFRWSYPSWMHLEWANDRAKASWLRRSVPEFAFLVDAKDNFWVVWEAQVSHSVDAFQWSAPRLIATGRPSDKDDSAYICQRAYLGEAASGDLLLLAPKSGQSRGNVALFSSLDGTEWVEKEVMGAADSGSLARGPKGWLVAVTGGGSRIFIRTSDDGRSWTGPLLVETYHTYPWHPTIALLSHDQCLVAFSSDEGLTVLRCRLPGAAAEEKLPATSVSAVAGPLEAGPTKQAAQPTILILPLRGAEGTELAPLGEGLVDLLTLDLARQEGVSVVDRSHLASVLQEQKLSLSGLVDQSAQLQVGKLLGAKLLLAGSFVLTQGKLTVTAHLFDVSTAQLVKSEGASGEVSDWLGVEKALALALAKDLNLKLDEVQVRAIDEKPEVNLHFIRGLGYYYANRHDEAIMEFLNTLFGDEKYVDARYWMARSYLATGEPEHARLELERIVREYPEHQLARSAKELLSQPISLGGQESPGP
jgi:TolB-like protein